MKKFSKGDLREKDLVQLRSEPDCLYMVIGDRLLTKDGYMPLYEYDEDMCCHSYDECGEDEFPNEEYDIVKVIRNVIPWNFRCLQTMGRTPILIQYADGLALDRGKFDYDEVLEIVYDRYEVDYAYVPDAILETIQMIVEKHKTIATWTKDEEYYIVRGSNREMEYSLDIISHCGNEVIPIDGLHDLLEGYLEYEKEYSISSLKPLSEKGEM